MGTRVAPTYANLFMGGFEKFALNSEFAKYIYKDYYRRFIDDMFLLWGGTVAQLEDFVTFLNQIHPTIKFMCSYDAVKREVSFLDVLVRIAMQY